MLFILLLSLTSAFQVKSQINPGDWPLDPAAKSLLADLARLEEQLTCVFHDKLCMAHGVYK